MLLFSFFFGVADFFDVRDADFFWEPSMANRCWLSRAPHVKWTYTQLKEAPETITTVLPGPPSLWEESWSHWSSFSVFLGSLHCASEARDLGVEEGFYLELLVLYELWSGERLVCEKAVLCFRRGGRPISASAALVGPGIDMRKSCRFLINVLRSLRDLLGGIERFHLVILVVVMEGSGMLGGRELGMD